MKLIIKHYLASLKERDELDAILPDLLSQLGLNVYSRPRKGTRQDGVDVGAVGSLNGNPEKVYLFSIKAGDLTRRSWGGDTLQSLRPSLDEILDAYIPNRLPNEHRDKDIVVCICLGGDIREEVRSQVEGYIHREEKKRTNLSFEEWNGDKLASLILSSFLQEDLLPQDARSQLRKSLALLDEPEASYQHFSTLVGLFFNTESTKDKDRIMAIRQINICLWILFSWARDAGNIESAYLSSELALLHAWELAKAYFTKKTKSAEAIQLAFQSILNVYSQIISLYLKEKILPHVQKTHSLSHAIKASSNLDINLKLFDVLGRLALGGLWIHWLDENEVEVNEFLRSEIQSYSFAVERLILNNPILLLPIKDDQAIDISIAMLLLTLNKDSHNFIREWFSEIVARTDFAHHMCRQYPCNLHNYNDLLEHPQRNNEGYRQKVTSGSILFPMLALWAALLGESELYSQVQLLKEKRLSHCNFQFWYPDDDSEKYFYTNKDIHGATLSQVCIERSLTEFLSEAFNECEHSPQFRTLSAVENNLWPVILVACRHYRLPVPLHLWKDLLKFEESPDK